MKSEIILQQNFYQPMVWFGKNFIKFVGAFKCNTAPQYKLGKDMQLGQG